ncbi:MAG TPA: O-antigen ligase family protein [Candidatus Luteococcus avicola]|nr:O-antigen ligase family protein [Candidatus Luteococcus avicola]
MSTQFSDGCSPDVGVPTGRTDPVFLVGRAIFLLGLAAVSALIFRIGPLTLGDLLLIGSAGLLVCSPVEYWRPRWPGNNVMTWLCLLIILGGCISSLFSPEPMQSFMVLVRIIYLVMILPWQASKYLPTGRWVRTGLTWMAAGGAACGVATLMQLVLGPTIIPGSETTNADRFPGLASHVSDTGGITALGAVAGIALLGRHKARGSDVVAALIATLSLIGVVLSGSVSGMMASVVGIGALLVTRTLSRAKTVTVIVLSGVGAILASIMITLMTTNGLTPIARLLQVLGVTKKYAGTDTSQSRWETIVLGWQGFGRHPWTGVGLEPTAAPVLYDLPVHNFYVSCLYQGGLIFGGALNGVLVVTFGTLLYRHKLNPTIGACIGLLVSVLLFAATAPSFYNRYLWVPLALSACAAWTVTRPTAEQDSHAVADGQTGQGADESIDRQAGVVGS